MVNDLNLKTRVAYSWDKELKASAKKVGEMIRENERSGLYDAGRLTRSGE